MITSTLDQVPDIQGLILIDCWEPSELNQKSVNAFYQRIVDTVAPVNLQCIINSANNVLIDMLDQSMANLFQIHCHTKIAALPEHLQQRHNQVIASSCRWANKDVSAHKFNTSSRLLHESILNNPNSVYLMTPLDMMFHNQIVHNASIKNWLVAGRSWRMCTHSNDLGLNNLAELASRFDVNFYATDTSFLKSDDTNTAQFDDFSADTLNWVEIKNFGYQLAPVPIHSKYAEFIAKYPYA